MDASDMLLLAGIDMYNGTINLKQRFSFSLVS